MSQKELHLIKKNLSYKRIGKKIIPLNRNIENQIINLKNEVKKYDSNKIVSIDETSFDTHIRATYGWSKKGERIKKIINTPVRKRKTLTLAITKNGILGYNIINNSSNTINFSCPRKWRFGICFTKYRKWYYFNG